MTLPLFDRSPLMDVSTRSSLRPYQDRCIKNLRAHIIGGKKRVLVVAPTGSGKMYIVATIIRLSTVPVLFVCHRMELIDQCARELARQGVTNIGVIRADDERTNPHASVQVASVQTLIRRPHLAPAPGHVIVDEAHRSASDSYVEHVFGAYPQADFFGFTASPARLDGKPLGDLFQIIEIAATYTELLKRSDWLVAPDVYSSPVQADLSEVRTVGGDYEEAALGQVMTQKHLVGNVVEHWLRLAHLHPEFTPDGKTRVPCKSAAGERRRTFAFAVNIAHSQALCTRFEQAGVRVAHLDGTTPENERRAMLRDLASGALEVVCNCNVLLEGVDVPEAKCIVHARPTQSLVVWMQSCGRIMRPWNGVTPLLLDHAGNFDRHGAPFEDRDWSLTQRPTRIRSSAPMKLCKKCFAYVTISKLVCPHCGWQFPEGSDKLPEEVAADLRLRDADPEPVRLAYFESMATLARNKGYRPGFASAKYKERYRRWPPWAWSEQVRASFASDKFWQDMLARREEKKAASDMNDAKEAENWGDGAEESPQESEHPFADWLDEQGITRH
jgi:DNA repair protein RadD